MHENAGLGANIYFDSQWKNSIAYTGFNRSIAVVGLIPFQAQVKKESSDLVEM